MSVLKTIPCPACGKTHLLGESCPCGGVTKTSRASGSLAPRIVTMILTFLGTAAVLVAGAMALAQSKGTGYGIALVVGAWILTRLCRLGYDFEDGIDVRMLMLPGPYDWPVKLESFINFWTDDRPYFRMVSLGTLLALAIVLIILLGPGRQG